MSEYFLSFDCANITKWYFNVNRKECENYSVQKKTIILFSMSPISPFRLKGFNVMNSTIFSITLRRFILDEHFIG